MNEAGCARGTFEVQMLPLALDDASAGPLLGRLRLLKTFAGDLVATGRGEMLTAGTAIPGSAGYVAIERVSGRLLGRSGSFMLQHLGVIERGAPQLSVTVVPDSGTEALQGLAGELRILVEGGQHRYEFDYRLPCTAP